MEGNPERDFQSKIEQEREKERERERKETKLQDFLSGTGAVWGSWGYPRRATFRPLRSPVSLQLPQ